MCLLQCRGKVGQLSSTSSKSNVNSSSSEHKLVMVVISVTLAILEAAVMIVQIL